MWPPPWGHGDSNLSFGVGLLLPSGWCGVFGHCPFSEARGRESSGTAGRFSLGLLSGRPDPCCVLRQQQFFFANTNPFQKSRALVSWPNRSPLRRGSLLARCNLPGQGSEAPFGGMLVQPSGTQVAHNAAFAIPPQPRIVPSVHINRSVTRCSSASPGNFIAHIYYSLLFPKYISCDASSVKCPSPHGVSSKPAPGRGREWPSS